jgi:hypothetical protein
MNTAQCEESGTAAVNGLHEVPAKIFIDDSDSGPRFNIFNSFTGLDADVLSSVADALIIVGPRPRSNMQTGRLSG